jgi:hypothetical protein
MNYRQLTCRLHIMRISESGSHCQWSPSVDRGHRSNFSGQFVWMARLDLYSLPPARFQPLEDCILSGVSNSYGLQVREAGSPGPALYISITVITNDNICWKRQKINALPTSG